MNKKIKLIIVGGNKQERLNLVNRALKMGWKFDGDDGVSIESDIKDNDYLCFNTGHKKSGGYSSIKYLHFWGCSFDEDALEKSEIYMDFTKNTFADILAAINIDDIIMSNKTIEDI